MLSHEGIRQQLLNTEVILKTSVPLEQEVVFVEVDGLYTKSQEKNKKGKEVKIASTHQGWEVNGKRAKLLEKRHFIHEGSLPSWEEFESFLMETCAYDPTKHYLVINGDGAPWITACRDYFRDVPKRYWMIKAPSVMRTGTAYLPLIFFSNRLA